MKKVLILSGSPRKGGNSDILCDQFARGALEAGNEVKKIFVAEKKIAPCSGCYFCRNHGGRCALNDDMGDVLQAMIDSDVLVLSSPVYFYSLSAQLKAVIDRTVARWTELANKELYYIATAAEADEDTLDTTWRVSTALRNALTDTRKRARCTEKAWRKKGKCCNDLNLCRLPMKWAYPSTIEKRRKKTSGSVKRTARF